MSRNLSPPKQDVIGDESTSSVLSKLAGSSPVTGKIGLEYLPSSLETTAGAQAKADAAQAAAALDATTKADAAASSSVSLLSTQIISGAKTFSAEMTSLAPLSGSSTQVPTIEQVRQQNRLTVAPLVRWNFNSASGTTVKSVSSSNHDATVNGTTTSYVEGSAGYSRQLLLSSADAHVIAPTKQWFNRLHQGLPTTFVLEGESLSVLSVSAFGLFGTGTTSQVAIGVSIFSQGGEVRMRVANAAGQSQDAVVAYIGVLTRLILKINGSSVTMAVANSAGATFQNTSTVTTFSPGVDSTYLARIGQFGNGIIGGHGMKISSLELYDRVIDI